MKYKKILLKNGIRVILVPMRENPTISVMVAVEAGSKYETAEESGLSHFLEHMCFKGTLKRPTAMAISRELDAIGAHYNASTGRESTLYYAKSDVAHGHQILDIIADIYNNSTFPEAEIEKEKGVVIEEIRMYRDDPSSRVHDVFMDLMHPGQPAGRDITGTEKTVSSFTREHLISYRNRTYVPEATVISVAGGFDEKTMMKDIKKYFEGIPAMKKAKKPAVEESQKTPRAALSFKESDQAHLILGFRSGVDRYSKLYPVGRVLGRILGGGMSSRLFQRLREEMGVCYYINAGLSAYTDHGHLSISCGVDKNRIDEVIKVLFEECKKFIDEEVTDEELNRIKQGAIGGMYLSLESSDSYGDFYALQELYHDTIESPKDVEKEIRSVTKKQIQALARKIFRLENANLAVVGPYKDKNFKPLLKF